MMHFVNSTKQIQNYPVANWQPLQLRSDMSRSLICCLHSQETDTEDTPNLSVGLGATWCLVTWRGKNNEVDINKSFYESLLNMREKFQDTLHCDK